MSKKKFSSEEVKKITGASESEKVSVPFYYAPPFLDELKKSIESRDQNADQYETMVEMYLPKDIFLKLQKMVDVFKKENIFITVDRLASFIIERAIKSGESGTITERKEQGMKKHEDETEYAQLNTEEMATLIQEKCQYGASVSDIIYLLSEWKKERGKNDMAENKRITLGKDQLRSLSDDYHRKNEQDIIDKKARTREEVFEKAGSLLSKAAREGKYEIIVYSADEYEMELSGCEYSMLDDPPEVVERAKEQLKFLGAERLRDVAGELRDWLIREGFSLSLRLRVEGNTCKTAHYVWDVVARW